MAWHVYDKGKNNIIWQLRKGEKIWELALNKGDDDLWYVFYRPHNFGVETVNTPNKSKAVALAFARLFMKQHPNG